MFQGLTQGATLYILYRNEPRIENGKILSVNTHYPQYNPAQPQALFNGMVTDITVSVGNETIPFAGIPATASVANFHDKGLFISEDEGMCLNELKSLREERQRIVDCYDSSKEFIERCDTVLIARNPEKQKELQSAKDVAEMKGELAEMKAMLSAILGTKKGD